MGVFQQPVLFCSGSTDQLARRSGCEALQFSDVRHGAFKRAVNLVIIGFKDSRGQAAQLGFKDSRG